MATFSLFNKTPTPVPTPTMSFQQKKAMQNYNAPQSTPNNFYYSGTNPNTATRVSQMNQIGSYIPPVKKAQSTSGTGTTGGSVLGLQSLGESLNTQQTNTDNSLTDLRQQELDAINSEYDQEISRLSGLESQTKGLYGEQQNTLTQRQPGLEQSINAERDLRMQELGNVETSRKQESQSALSKVRNMLNELQRRQGAYMSATGSYSTSTPEAFGESFGRQAFNSLSEVQKQRDQALRDVEVEKGKAQQFYSGKLTEAKQMYENNLAELNRNLLSALDQINSAKGAAESAKRAQSIDVWRTYTANKLQLDQGFEERKTSLAQWLTNMQAQQDQAKMYQTGQISNLNLADTFSNILNALNTTGTQVGQNPVINRALSTKPKEDELLAGLNTPYVTGAA